MERYIAIDNVCAWPNLTVLPDGTLTVTIYNRPVHGRWYGDVEVWASTDEGRQWQKRGSAAPGEPPGNRMNVARLHTFFRIDQLQLVSDNKHVDGTAITSGNQLLLIV